jgi:hypothetical protein
VSPVLEGAVKTTTELSNDTKSLLDQANQAPVIIKRERQQEPIVLMNRRVAHGALAAREFVNELSAIMEYALARGAGDVNPPYPIELEWLRVFSPQDVRGFATEFAQAVRRVTRDGRPIAEVETVVEQWRKSALVISDEALSARLKREMILVRDELAAH